MTSRAPLLTETPFHAETPSPPRLEYPPSRHSWVRTEALLKRETKAQEAGKKVAAMHRLLAAVVPLTAQFIQTLRNGIVVRMRWRAALAPLRISMAACLNLSRTPLPFLPNKGGGGCGGLPAPILNPEDRQPASS
jgi:hypothetical protein